MSTPPGTLNQSLISIGHSQDWSHSLLLQDSSGFDIDPGFSLRLGGPILRDPLMPGGPLWKLGQGHLQLDGANTYNNTTILHQGSLGLGSSQALGTAISTLSMAAGTRLELADGVQIGNFMNVYSAGTATAPWGAPPPVPDPTAPVVWHVASGLATWLGNINFNAPMAKEGAGTLQLQGAGFPAGVPATLHVREGGLRVNGSWAGHIQTSQNTILSGTGWISSAQVAGRLQPGGAGTTGRLGFTDQLQLEPQAQTRIRIDATGQAGLIHSQGTVALAGELLVVPSPGSWDTDSRWTIVQADGGLVPGAGTGRYASARSSLRYLSPVLYYTPQQLVLGLRHNRLGLNSADANWRSSLLHDSRFPREAAIRHGASGDAWAESWAAGIRHKADGNRPGARRNTSGLQLGVSRAIGKGSHLAVFAGWQGSNSRQTGGHASDIPAGTAADQGQAYRSHDTALHVGSSISIQGHGWQGSLGAMHAWHRAHISRQADLGEARIHSRARAGLSQIWLHAGKADTESTISGWAWQPHATLAWLHLRRPGVLEADDSLAAVSMPAKSDSRWLSHLGLRGRYTWPTASGSTILNVDLGLSSLWGGNSLYTRQQYRAAPGRMHTAAGLPASRQALRLDMGLQKPLGKRARLGLAYSGMHSTRARQHGLWLNLQMALDGPLGSTRQQ